MSTYYSSNNRENVVPRSEHYEQNKQLMKELMENKTEGKILKKKKKKQLKLKEAFVGRNSQGYLLNQCYWDEALNKHVYEPKQYTKKVNTSHFHYGLVSQYPTCPDCLLKPCVLTAFKKEINYDICQMVQRGRDAKQCIDYGRALCITKFRSYCGALWCKRNKCDKGFTSAPACVNPGLSEIVRLEFERHGEEFELSQDYDAEEEHEN